MFTRFRARPRIDAARSIATRSTAGATARSSSHNATLAGLVLLAAACGSSGEDGTPAASGGAGGVAAAGSGGQSESGEGGLAAAGRAGQVAGAAGGSSAAGGWSGRAGSGGAGGRAAGGRGGQGASGAGGRVGSGGSSGASSRAGAGGAAGASLDPTCLHDGDGKTTLAFVNGCTDAVTFAGSDIEGGTLSPGAAQCVDIGSDVEALSAKRYWGFSGDDPGAEHHSLAEFTFNTDFNDFDWYNISYVDAFNLPLAIEPFARPDCKTLTCASDFLAQCPAVGQYEQGGKVVACVSPERNDGASEVAQYFEQCDDAYAWSGDDQNGDDPSPVRACAGEDWVITFCPAEPE